MHWELTRGKFRPRLLGYVADLDEEVVKSASQKALLSLPADLSKAVSELIVLKGYAGGAWSFERLLVEAVFTSSCQVAGEGKGREAGACDRERFVGARSNCW
ncbi:hypothetical protein vseg_017928 [Gypsophila vaccaria]